DVWGQGFSAAAMDGVGSAGLRHDRRRLQSRYDLETRSRHVQDYLRAHATVMSVGRREMRGVGMVALIAVSAASVASAATTVPLPRPAPLRSMAPAAMGTRDAQHLLIDRINAYFTNMQTLVGDFVQIGPDGRRSEGQFYIQKPGKVRFEYNPPTPIDV